MTQHANVVRRQTAALVICCVIAVVSVLACNPIRDGSRFDSALPPGATLIVKTRCCGGLLGGGAWERIYTSGMVYGDVLERYRSVAADHGGTEKLNGLGTSRFDLGGDCVEIRAWSTDDAKSFRGVLTAGQLDQLATAHTFIETRVDDCSYHG